MEVYLDNLLVASKKPEQHLTDLHEAFAILQRYRMKLNPSKCAFKVELGKFLGFMVSEREIDANPERVEVVVGMLSPSNLHKVQRLDGRVAALNHFIAWSTDRCLRFFKVLSRVQEWDEAYEEAFTYLKR